MLTTRLHHLFQQARQTLPDARCAAAHAQNGFTTTRMTMPIISAVGTSFIIR